MDSIILICKNKVKNKWGKGTTTKVQIWVPHRPFPFTKLGEFYNQHRRQNCECYPTVASFPSN